jgi:hypothetical protein
VLDKEEAAAEEEREAQEEQEMEEYVEGDEEVDREEEVRGRGWGQAVGSWGYSWWQRGWWFWAAGGRQGIGESW